MTTKNLSTPTQRLKPISGDYLAAPCVEISLFCAAPGALAIVERPYGDTAFGEVLRAAAHGLRGGLRETGLGLDRLAVLVVFADTAVEALDENPPTLEREFVGRMEFNSRFKLLVCASAARALANSCSMEALEVALLETVGDLSTLGLFSRTGVGRARTSLETLLFGMQTASGRTALVFATGDATGDDN